ncbi:MAG: class I SAM-dependent methyltransferase, partial [Verrucomicrobiota bacterium]|nr:class I SAM-dependent methyltransferase [Verrucomicrobiota bacterium]
LYLWTLNVGYAFRRIFSRFLPKKNADREAPKLKLGDATANLQTTATERMLRYGIDFTAGYSVGLFIDQRENRRFVRELRPKSMLNCFAYTCSFSVVAASVGAATVSIDLSKKSLARGRENFALNSIPTTDHKFIADDVMEVLPRMARKGTKFDVIILDPPTFSRSHKGKAFQVEKDFETLLLAALEVTERGGEILLSTNCSTLDERGLEVLGRYCLKATRRAGTFRREIPLADFPPRVGASSVWLNVR